LVKLPGSRARILSAMFGMVTACVHPWLVEDVPAVAANSASISLTDVYLLDKARLLYMRVRFRHHDESVAVYAEALSTSAEKRLACGPYSVTSKTILPPSGIAPFLRKAAEVYRDDEYRRLAKLLEQRFDVGDRLRVEVGALDPP
jgi:hypothetical protein